MTEEENSFEDLHRPVLLRELVNGIRIFDDRQNVIVDCTLGIGGHANEILKRMKRGDVFIGFDVDYRNFKIAKSRLEKDFSKSGIELRFINDNFANLKERLKELGIDRISGIYYDLGLSSLHLDEKERGFSFRLDGPLDMRFDLSSSLKASDIVNSYKKEDLIRIFREYGEEPLSKKIAEEIVSQRKKGFRFKTTKELSDLIKRVSKSPKSRARVFQALRIETNSELESIEKSIRDGIDILEKGGNIFVISFHSLEDRVVKNIFRNESRDCVCDKPVCICKHKRSLRIVTKKPVTPTDEEIKANPRSRSARARIATKI